MSKRVGKFNLIWKFYHHTYIEADDLLAHHLDFSFKSISKFPDILFSSSGKVPIDYYSTLNLSYILITFYAFKYSYFSYLTTLEVESAYERALEEEEERILCMRKKLLLSTRKVREREHEMMIQGRQSVMRKQLETRENELNEMLKRLEKQVKENSLN